MYFMLYLRGNKILQLSANLSGIGVKVLDKRDNNLILEKRLDGEWVFKKRFGDFSG